MSSVAGLPAVTIYTTGPRCQRCKLTRFRFEQRGIPYREIDITLDEHAAVREWLTEDLGYAEAPVVVVEGEPEHHWSGFDPALIDRLAEHINAGVRV